MVDEEAETTDLESSLASSDGTVADDDAFGGLGVGFTGQLEPSLTTLREPPPAPTDPSELEQIQARPLRWKHMWMLDKVSD